MASLALLWLSLLFVAVRRAAGDDTTTQAHGDCVTVFTAENKNDKFLGSCEPITFPCSTKPGAGYYAVPDDCVFYFRCVLRSVIRCSSPANTGFDINTSSFIHTFDANCTCPNGVKSNVMPKKAPTSRNTTSMPPKKSETGGIIGGVVALMVVAVVVVVLVFVLRRRNISRLSREEKQDVCRDESVQDKNGVCRVNSVQSDTYDELKDIEPQYDNNTTAVSSRNNLSTVNRGPLPEVPDVDDKTYLDLRRLTEEIPARDGENKILADGERNNTEDGVYLNPGEQVDSEPRDDVDSVAKSVTDGQ